MLYHKIESYIENYLQTDSNKVLIVDGGTADRQVFLFFFYMLIYRMWCAVPHSIAWRSHFHNISKLIYLVYQAYVRGSMNVKCLYLYEKSLF